MDGQTALSVASARLGTRRRAEAFGRQAEVAVAEGLRARGYAILARRLRSGAGEIDLVVANAETLLFVEVKARGDATTAAYAVGPRQQQRLLLAAEAALAAHQDWQRPATRFDVALVHGDRIDTIEDAIRYN